jgi:hypothetical protein
MPALSSKVSRSCGVAKLTATACPAAWHDLPVEIAQLVAFLAPFLGPLLRRTEEATAGAIESFGESAWERATALWQRLRGSTEASPTVTEAVEDVAADPDNDRAQAALAWQLEKLLAANPRLGEELTHLWTNSGGNTITAVTASGERSIAIGGSVSGSHVATGNVGDTSALKPQQPPSRA